MLKVRFDRSQMFKTWLVAVVEAADDADEALAVVSSILAQPWSGISLDIAGVNLGTETNRRQSVLPA